MRLLCLAISFALLPTWLWAESMMSSSIHHLDHGDQMGDETLIYLSNGRVLRMNSFDLNMIEEMQEGVQNKQVFNFSLNDANEILDLKLSELQPTHIPPLNNKRSQEIVTYVPSIMSKDKAQALFNESMQSPNDSQCYNRAHVWSHEWRIKHKVYTNKIWIYFTRKYIREFAFTWWFHVAPVVHMVEDGKVRERVMDVKYARGPLKLKDWSDIFMRNDAPCPLVDKYTDQSNFPEWGSCFVMKSSMYFYQPVDLEWQEAFGMDKTAFIPSEVVNAYLEAFNIEI